MANHSSTAGRATRLLLLIAVPVAVVAGFAVGGGHRAAAGSATGFVTLLLFFAGGRAPMLLARIAPAGPLFVLIATGYVLRIVLLLAVFKGLSDAHWLDRSALAATLIAGALAWTACLVRAHFTSSQPTIVMADAAPQASPPALSRASR